MYQVKDQVTVTFKHKKLVMTLKIVPQMFNTKLLINSHFSACIFD